MSQGHQFSVIKLSAGYKSRPVLQSLSIEPLRSGQITVLAGPNGAGKSTLLRALAGLMPSEGTLSLDGTDLNKLSTAERADKVCFIPQSLPPGVALTVFETVLSALKVVGSGQSLSENDAREKVWGTLERTGIQHLALKRLDQLSGGERQLSGLAQALVRNPIVLLLDEPTSALDLRHQLTVMNTVRGLADEGRVVVAVLHDLALAAKWADRIVLLESGKIVSDGNPLQSFTPELLSRVYGVKARIETCSKGTLQIIVDDISDEKHAGTH